MPYLGSPVRDWCKALASLGRADQRDLDRLDENSHLMRKNNFRRESGLIINYCLIRNEIQT